jgi:hypothetical protein
MMRWRGHFPANIPLYPEHGREVWCELAWLRTNATEAVRIRDLHYQRATAAFARFGETGEGAGHGVESACYTNVIQMALNREAGRSLLTDLPFPVPGLEEVPRSIGKDQPTSS